MNRLCTCTGYGAGAAVCAALGLAVVSSMGFGPATGGCCFIVPPTSCDTDGDCPTGETCVANECTNTGGQTDCDALTEADCTAAGGTYLGDNTNCDDCHDINCVSDPSECQSPNIGQFPGGTILTSADTADNFNATSDVITKVCFYGAYIDIANTVDCDEELNLADDIQIRIWPSTAGLPPFPTPGAPIFTGTVNAGNTTRRATGFEFGLGGFAETVSEYEWTVDLTGQMPANTLTPGECYWIRINNTVTSDNPGCSWFWEISPEAVNDPVNGDGDDTSINFQLLFDCVTGGQNPVICAGDSDNPYDMAWCIDFDLDPVDKCYLPIISGCEVVSCTTDGDCPAGTTCVDTDDDGIPDTCDRGPCNVPNATAGCDDPECCSLVCTPKAQGGAGQALCCLFPWSQACTDAAIDFGCTPLPPCQPEENCQLVTEANAFNSTVATLVEDEQFISADDFTPLNDGVINDICWYGSYTYHDPANPESDEFTVTYYADNDGLPGAALIDAMGNPASYNSLAGTLVYNEADEAHKRDSNLDIGGGNDPIFVFFAQHESVPVTAGTCYWIEITNKIGDPVGEPPETSSWFWSWGDTSDAAPFYSGNGRMTIDGSPPDGYDAIDTVGATDLSFCLGLEVSKPTCGLGTLFTNGAHHPVLFNGAGTNLGWSSGQLCMPTCLDDEFPQRRTAQAFSLGPVAEGAGTDHRIRYIYVNGFEVAGNLNEDFNFNVFSRNGLDRPDENDILVEGTMPYDAIIPVNDPEGGTGGSLWYFNVDFSLPGNADYWLTVWASNSSEGQIEPSHWAWFTNVHNGIKNSCAADPDCIGPTPEDDANEDVLACAPRTGPPSTTADCNDTVGDPMMWRSRRFPDGAPGDPDPNDGFGFGSYSLTVETLAWSPTFDPDGDPANLYNAALKFRGEPGGTCGNSILEPGEQCDPPGAGCNSVCRLIAVECPWDCANNDGAVNVSDLLALLAQWDITAPVNCTGGTCDFNGDGCVDVADLLKLLAHYDPAGVGCPQ